MSNDKQRKGIAIIGTKARGGIRAVIENHIQAGVYDGYHHYFIASHDDGSVMKRFLVYFSAMFSLLGLLMTRKISICHLHGSHKGSIFRKAFFIFLCRLFGCKVIFHPHGSVFARTYDNAGGFYKRMVRYVLNHADSVFVLSEYWANYVKSISNNHDIRIINNFPSPVFEALFDTRDFSKKTDLELLFLGFIGPRKGIYDLVDAVVLLKQRGVTGFKIKVGGNGEIDKLKAMISEKGVEDYFDVIGWVTGDLKYQLIQESDLLLLPSHNEGLPIAIVEAMSAGLAVLSTTVGGIPEAIPDDTYGLLIEPGLPEALSGAICRFIETEGLIETAARNSRARYETTYSAKANLVVIRSVLNGLLSQDQTVRS